MDIKDQFKATKLFFSSSTPAYFDILDNQGMYYIDIPSPKTVTPLELYPPKIRLRTSIYLSKGPTGRPNPIKGNEPNDLCFSFESIHYSFNIDIISEYEMQNYYNDLEFIVRENYGFSNSQHKLNFREKEFWFKLDVMAGIYSVEEFKFILYLYKNPIEYQNNHLQINTNYTNPNYVYKIQVSNITIFFDIDLDKNETYCLTRIY